MSSKLISLSWLTNYDCWFWTSLSLFRTSISMFEFVPYIETISKCIKGGLGGLPPSKKHWDIYQIFSLTSFMTHANHIWNIISVTVVPSHGSCYRYLGFPEILILLPVFGAFLHYLIFSVYENWITIYESSFSGSCLPYFPSPPIYRHFLNRVSPNRLWNCSVCGYACRKKTKKIEENR